MKSIVLSLLLVASLTACKKNLGKKVLIEGTKAEVYYKGDGVTEADALKLGAWLKNQNVINNTTDQSIILSKGDDSSYEIRLVGTGESSPERTQAMQQLGAGLSIEVFDNKGVNIVIVDKNDKGLQVYPFSRDAVKQLQEALDKAKQDAAPIDTMSTMPVEDTATNNNQ